MRNTICRDLVQLQEIWSKCWNGFNDRLLALESSLQELIRCQQNTIRVFEKIFHSPAQAPDKNKPMETDKSRNHEKYEKVFYSPAQLPDKSEPMETDESINHDENVRLNEMTESLAHFKWLESEFAKRFQLPTKLPQTE